MPNNIPIESDLDLSQAGEEAQLQNILSMTKLQREVVLYGSKKQIDRFKNYIYTKEEELDKSIQTISYAGLQLTDADVLDLECVASQMVYTAKYSVKIQFKLNECAVIVTGRDCCKVASFILSLVAKLYDLSFPLYW